MGQFSFSMSQPNQMDMEDAAMDFSMGESHVYDLQNFRFSQGDFKGSMGELGLYSSGPMVEDMKLKVRMSMGEADLLIPENVRLENNTGVFLGESTGGRSNGVEDPDAPLLTLNGGMTMGELRIRRGVRQKSQRARMIEKARTVSVDELIEEIRTLKQKNPNDETFNESQINRLGYDLLQSGRKEDAIAIFRLNLELHPKYVNGHDSLGEGLYSNGQYEEAIQWFEKVLEFEPNNRRAADFIRRAGEKLERSAQ